MSIDRIGTLANAQLLLGQLRHAESLLDESNRQVASGKLANSYSGYGAKTAALEAARSTASRTVSDAAVAREAQRQLDFQDTQVTQLGNLAAELRQTLTDTIATGDASVLMTQVQGFFERTVQVLNTKDDGTYLYGGGNSDTSPLTVSTLSDLAALPSVASAFANGSVKRSLKIGEGQTLDFGLLASDLGTELFTMFRDITQWDQSVNGPFGSSLTAGQETFLTGNIQSAIDAANNLNGVAAANGYKFQTVKNTATRLDAARTVYESFVSDIEDVDMPSAVSKLNQNQVMLQAALQVTAKLSQISLLDYL